MKKFPKAIVAIFGISFFVMISLTASYAKDDVIWLDKKFNNQSYVTLDGPYPKLNEKFGFIEGLAPIGILEGQSGYIDKNGNLVFMVPGKLTYAYNFHEGIGCAIEEDKTIYLNRKGEVIKQVYSGGNFSEGICPIKFTPEDKWCYVNKKFEPLFTIDYEYPGDFKEGLAIVGRQIKDSFYPDETFKYGYMDRSGKVVIPVKYDYAFDFKDGIATVFLGDKKIYIDKNGNEVENKKSNDDLTVAQFGDKFGFKDKDGRFVIHPKYDSANEFSDGLAKVEINGKFGYIDRQGNMVVPAIYDQESNDFNEGAAIIKKNGKLGIIKNPIKIGLKKKIKNLLIKNINS